MKRAFVALEDVSIIVPIAVAIILFFAALAWSISAIQNTNTSVDLTLKLIDLADVFTSPGVLTRSSFATSCTSAATLMSGYGYVVYITDPDPSHSKSIQSALESCGGEVKTTLVCTSLAGTFGGCKLPSHTTIVTRAFPIPFQTTLDGLPYNEVNMLVIAIWRGA